MEPKRISPGDKGLIKIHLQLHWTQGRIISPPLLICISVKPVEDENMFAPVSKKILSADVNEVFWNFEEAYLIMNNELVLIFVYIVLHICSCFGNNFLKRILNKDKLWIHLTKDYIRKELEECLIVL